MINYLKNPERVVTLDFETYYDSKYSLTAKDMNTSEYIRDPRFKIHCVGIKIGNGETRVYSGARIEEELRKLPWEDLSLLCHNTAFDGLILSHWFGLKPKIYLDTLSMARGIYSANSSNALDAVATRLGIGGKIPEVLSSSKGLVILPALIQSHLEEYCARDVDLTWEVFTRIYGLIPDHELELIDVTIRMFCDPIIQIDEELVEQAILDESATKKNLVAELGVTIKQLRSDEMFAGLLRAAGVDPPSKKNSAGQKAWAFAKSDESLQALLRHPSDYVNKLARARIAVKTSIAETRAARILKAGENGQRLPILLNYCGAHTTRWSGGNKLNLQNLPKGGPLRKALMAPEGHVLCVGDSRQIEPRLLMWFSDERTLLEAFRDGDAYIDMAKRLFGVESPTKEQRFIGKVCVIGLGYGMGHLKLQRTLAQGILGPPVSLSTEECKEIVNSYRTRMTKVTELWKELENELVCMQKEKNKRVLKCLEFGYERVRLPNNLKLHYPGLTILENGIRYDTRDGFSYIYGGLFTENLIQAMARCIVGEQIRMISKRYRVVTMSHDEIVWVAPKEEADEALKFGFDIMKVPPVWAPELPLDVEGGYDERYMK